MSLANWLFCLFSSVGRVLELKAAHDQLFDDLPNNIFHVAVVM